MRLAIAALMLILIFTSCASHVYTPTKIIAHPPIPDELPPVVTPPIVTPPVVTPPVDPPQLDPTLDKTKLGYWFRRATNHAQPTPGLQPAWLKKYDVIALGPNENKHIYLTFDNGYELGYTPIILDALKEAEVTAAFFVTGQFVSSHPELIKRMHREGHIIANHTVNHPSIAELTPLAIEKEIRELDNMLRALIGQGTQFFRPPMGEYSEHSIAVVNALGYRHVFWSLAYKDWLTNEQPGAQYAYDHVMANIHPGAVVLLHSVSQSNTEALPRILQSLKADGWTFRPLTDFLR